MNWVYFRIIPRALNWLAGLSLFTLLLKIFVFNKFIEPLSGMSQFGVVLEGVFGSVIASYVFYLIVIHYKEISGKRIINPHIIRWSQCLVGECKSQLVVFSNTSGISLCLGTLEPHQVKSSFEKINPNTKAPLFLSLEQEANWIQYLLYHKNKSKTYISKIMSQLIYLEAPLVSALTKIDDCTHFNQIDMVASYPVANKNMSAFANKFFNYCIACKELDIYLQTYLDE